MRLASKQSRSGRAGTMMKIKMVTGKRWKIIIKMYNNKMWKLKGLKRDIFIKFCVKGFLQNLISIINPSELKQCAAFSLPSHSVGASRLPAFSLLPFFPFVSLTLIFFFLPFFFLPASFSFSLRFNNLGKISFWWFSTRYASIFSSFWSHYSSQFFLWLFRIIKKKKNTRCNHFKVETNRCILDCYSAEKLCFTENISVAKLLFLSLIFLGK